MNPRNWLMPLYIGAVSGAMSHGLTDPKFWAVLAIGNVFLFVERSK